MSIIIIGIGDADFTGISPVLFLRENYDVGGHTFVDVCGDINI